jgi:hypothetical protein
VVGHSCRDQSPGNRRAHETDARAVVNVGSVVEMRTWVMVAKAWWMMAKSAMVMKPAVMTSVHVSFAE